MSNSTSSPVKASVGYTAANYLLKGISFVSVPIFTRVLSQEDFGIYNTFLAYEAILYILVGLALHSSLKNAYIKFGERFDKYVSSISILPLFFACSLMVIGYLLRHQIGSLINLDYRIVVWLVIHSYCSTVIIFYSSKIALTYNYKEYIKVSTINAVGNILLSLILIYTVFPLSRYMGRIVGSTAVYIIVTGYIVYHFFKKEKPVFDKTYILYALRVSIPIIPHGLAQILLLQFDRIMINSYIGSKEAAIYSFSYSIYSIVQITTNSLSTVFEPWFFKKMSAEENNRVHICKIGTGIATIITFIILGIMIFSPEAILVLGGDKYIDSFDCLLPVLFAGFFAMTYIIPSVVEYYYEKTKYIAIGTAITAIMNAVLNIICIPRYGYVAAAYTTLASYIIYYTIHYVISRQLYKDYIIKMSSNVFFVFTLVLTFVFTTVFKTHIFARIIFFTSMTAIYSLFIFKTIGKKDIIRIIRSVAER